MTTSKSQKVKLFIYGTDYNNAEVEYDGRCLGFINEPQFVMIEKDKELRSKVYTSESKTLNDIKSETNIKGMRLVLAISKNNKESILGKKLLVTEPLDFVSVVDKDCICFVSESGSYIEMGLN